MEDSWYVVVCMDVSNDRVTFNVTLQLASLTLQAVNVIRRAITPARTISISYFTSQTSPNLQQGPSQYPISPHKHLPTSSKDHLSILFHLTNISQPPARTISTSYFTSQTSPNLQQGPSQYPISPHKHLPTSSKDHLNILFHLTNISQPPARTISISYFTSQTSPNLQQGPSQHPISPHKHLPPLRTHALGNHHVKLCPDKCMAQYRQTISY